MTFIATATKICRYGATPKCVKSVDLGRKSDVRPRRKLIHQHSIQQIEAGHVFADSRIITQS